MRTHTRNAHTQNTNTHNTQFKKEYPGVGAAELSKKMGAAWKEMDPSEKEQYDDQAKKVCVGGCLT